MRKFARQIFFVEDFFTKLRLNPSSDFDGKTCRHADIQTDGKRDTITTLCIHFVQTAHKKVSEREFFFFFFLMPFSGVGISFLLMDPLDIW
jgi:hypothetical protein